MTKKVSLLALALRSFGVSVAFPASCALAASTSGALSTDTGTATASTPIAATPSAAAVAAMPSAAEVQSVAQSAVAAATSATYAAVLQGASFGMTCDGDATVRSTGNTADTDGLIAMIASAANNPQGAALVLPPGLCIINATLAIPVAEPMRFEGAGIGVTFVQFYTLPGASAPVQDGLHFNMSNDVSLTVDDFTIDRHIGGNAGTPLIGTAITVSSTGNVLNTGNVTVKNLDIYPAVPNGQTDSWNIGIEMLNIPGPVISNVTISLPTWSTIPDPSGYQCTDGNSGNFPCAIHALPSPANPVSTPSNLGFGMAATGVAIGGSGSGLYAIDSVIEALSVSGGLVGLDLAQFQGAYVTDSKFASTVYGVRADSPGTLSELLSVENSLFTTVTGGVYTNGIGGVQITGNYFTPTNASTNNIPDWTGIWSRNDNDVTITGNNVIGVGNAVAPEYGIFESADVLDGFPFSITGNTLFDLATPGSVCLGNDANLQEINASGNTLTQCATYLADANGGNGYGDNSFQTPDIYDDGHDDLTFAKSVTIGSLGNAGSLSIDDNGQQTFYLGSLGQIFTLGSFTTGGAVTANGTIAGDELITSGPLVMSGSSSHNLAEEVVGNFYFPAGGNSPTITLVQQPGNPPAAAFPAFAAGLTTIYGELTCSANNGIVISWRYDGHYQSNGKTLTPLAFAATVEPDSDSQAAVKQLTGTATVTPIANPSTPGLQVVFGTGIYATYDCTAKLTELVAD